MKCSTPEQLRRVLDASNGLSNFMSKWTHLWKHNYAKQVYIIKCPYLHNLFQLQNHSILDAVFKSGEHVVGRVQAYNKSILFQTAANHLPCRANGHSREVNVFPCCCLLVLVFRTYSRWIQTYPLVTTASGHGWTSPLWICLIPLEKEISLICQGPCIQISQQHLIQGS